MNRHITHVICCRRLRDVLRKTYWVVCPHCDLNVGPLPLGLACIAQVDYEYRPCERSA